ncbi:MAG: polysaccharide lyase family 8 super-sandwich domain-containing protein [Planctomycetota bacterium]
MRVMLAMCTGAMMCLNVTAAAFAAGDDRIATLRARADDLLSGAAGPTGGPRHRAAVAALDDETASILEDEAAIDLAGLDDVAYGDRLGRFFNPAATLARAYRAPGGRYVGHPVVLERIEAYLRAGLPYVRPGSPRPGNWHNYVIRIPRSLTVVALLVGRDLDDDVRRDLETCLEALLVDMQLTGANAASEARNHLVYAFYKRDADRVAAAVRHVLPAITIGTGGGVLEDYAYQFHGRILYAGTYGSGYVRSLATIAYLVDGTPWEIPVARKRILVGTALEHMQWVTYGPAWDLSVTGRGHDDRRNARGLLTAMLYMARLDAVDARALEVAAARLMRDCDGLDLEVAGMADAVGGVDPPPLEGFRYYHTSDFGLIRNERFYVSVKMVSKWMQDYEYLTGKGRFGWNLSNGLTYVSLGRAELWAGPGRPPIRSWDWDHLPGTTSRVGANPLNPTGDISDTGGSLNYGRGDFSGGAGDGRGGMLGFTLIPTHGEFVARKAYLLFDEGVVALGGGVTSTADRPEPVHTTVAQWAAETDDAPLHLSGDRTLTTWTGAQALTNVRWAWLDGVGYVFFEPVTLHAERNGRLTALWLDHGAAPADASYAYVILPGATREATAAFDAHGRFEIDATSARQAVHDTAAGVWAAVFHAPGAFGPLAVAKPAIVHLRHGSDGAVLAVQNPHHTREPLTVTVADLPSVTAQPDEATVERDGAVTRVTLDTALGRFYRLGFGPAGAAVARQPREDLLWLHDFAVEADSDAETTLLTVRLPERVADGDYRLTIRGYKGHTLHTLTDADLLDRPLPDVVRYRWTRSAGGAGDEIVDQVAGSFRFVLLTGPYLALDYVSVPPFDADGNALSPEGLPRDLTRPPYE